MRPLILLHGALGAPAQLEPLAALLRNQYEVYMPTFPGHAGVPAIEYRMESFAQFLEKFIEEHSLRKPLLFGYSMGGYAALILAKKVPGIAGAIATLATKFEWNPESAAEEVKQLEPGLLQMKLPAFAEALKARHAPLAWEDVVRGTADLMLSLGAEPLLTNDVLASLALPVLLLLGDRDKMVSLIETELAYRAIPGAQFGILPGTPHPLEKAPLEILACQLHQFFKNVPNES